MGEPAATAPVPSPRRRWLWVGSALWVLVPPAGLALWMRVWMGPDPAWEIGTAIAAGLPCLGVGAALAWRNARVAPPTGCLGLLAAYLVLAAVTIGPGPMALAYVNPAFGPFLWPIPGLLAVVVPPCMVVGFLIDEARKHPAAGADQQPIS